MKARWRTSTTECYEPIGFVLFERVVCGVSCDLKPAPGGTGGGARLRAQSILLGAIYANPNTRPAPESLLLQPSSTHSCGQGQPAFHQQRVVVRSCCFFVVAPMSGGVDETLHIVSAFRWDNFGTQSRGRKRLKGPVRRCQTKADSGVISGSSAQSRRGSQAPLAHWVVA